MPIHQRHLDYLMRQAEDDPTLMSSESRQLTNHIKKECETILEQLPGDARLPLKRIYDKSISALVEGWVLEFLSAYLDQAKTLGPQ